MELQEFFNRMCEEVSEFSIGRGDSAAFLIWFLDNFFRLETEEATDSVCDQKNDKGIDGIYVDEEEEAIYLFQSKFSPNDRQDQGDVDLKTFFGARSLFGTEETVTNLLNSTACRELKSLIERTKVKEKTHYKLISVFVTNKNFNRHANEYLNSTQDLEGYDSAVLFQKFTYFVDEENVFPRKELFVTNHSKIEYALPDGVAAKVYSIKAKELLRLEGIQDRTLFSKDVRYGVGKTRVNKSIKSTIGDRDEHNNFFLYHNGITIVCENLEEDLQNNKIALTNYAVINGCQSMLAFYENRTELSNNLFVLVKIIELTLTSQRVKKITYYANNQNSISLKDLRSNDSVQRALQTEFEKLFGKSVLYNRKRGESKEGYTKVIEKDHAAQLIEAVYFGKPHNTHLKQKLFGEEYSSIFSRRMNAEKIYFASLIYDIIKNNSELLDNEKIRNYGLSLFFFSYAVFKILGEDDLGREIIDNPKEYVTTNKDVSVKALEKLWQLITPDINMNIEDYAAEHDDFFDYKNVFKNSKFVDSMCGKIKANYIRITRRDSNYSFKKIYEEANTEQMIKPNTFKKNS